MGEAHGALPRLRGRSGILGRGARLPNGLTIEAEHLMILAKTMSIHLKARRAVIQRSTTAPTSPADGEF
jgi:hypothetical protein